MSFKAQLRTKSFNRTKKHLFSKKMSCKDTIKLTNELYP